MKNLLASRLSPRESAIIEAWGRGLTYEQAAHELHMAIGSFNTHVWRMFKKLKVHSQEAAVARAKYEPMTRRRVTKTPSSPHQQTLWDSAA